MVALRWLPDEPLPPTALSIAAAKAARDAERAEVTRVTGHVIEDDGWIVAAPPSACAIVRGMRTNTIDPDDGRSALAMANFVASAVYGPKGEGRCRR